MGPDVGVSEGRISSRRRISRNSLNNLLEINNEIILDI